MKSKDYYKKLNSKFENYWSKKRENKLKYVLYHTSYFALPLSIILGISNYGFSGLFSTKNLFLTFLTYLIYGSYVLYIEFKINEKRYQKIIKEKQSFDH